VIERLVESVKVAAGAVWRRPPRGFHPGGRHRVFLHVLDAVDTLPTATFKLNDSTVKTFAWMKTLARPIQICVALRSFGPVQVG
jgi:hypothetical protein